MRMNHAYGAFLGLACGDAAGAVLEFFRRHITNEIVEKAIKMPGGGAVKVGSGQLTDDSELAISLANALSFRNPDDGLPIEQIALNYSEWFYSNPFDIGSTCAQAFSTSKKMDTELLSSRMMKNAVQNSIVSEANGALMRVTPIALWCIDQSDSVIAHFAKMDAMLSHPSQVCQDCNAVFCILLVYLIKNPRDSLGAISHAADYISENVHSKVKKWFFEDSLDINGLDCTKNIGHVRWAFTLAIYFLRNNTPYETAIKITLMKGGDTDTNAAIVGALMGAVHGETNIPEYMKNPVIRFDPLNTKNGHKRPEIYTGAKIQDLTYNLLYA